MNENILMELASIEEVLKELQSVELNYPTSHRDVRVLRQYLEYKADLPETKAKVLRRMVGEDFDISQQSVGNIIYVKLYRFKKYLEEK